MNIVFTGSGSTGKSTLLDLLRKEDRFKNFTFLDSITADVRKRGFVINEQGTDETQLALAEVHKHNLEVYNNFIASRCMLDCYCYSVYLYNHNQIFPETLGALKGILLECLPRYDYIFYLKPEFKAVPNDLRSTNQSFINEVAEIFEDTVKSLGISNSIHELHGTIEERMNQMRTILN